MSKSNLELSLPNRIFVKHPPGIKTVNVNVFFF